MDGGGSVCNIHLLDKSPQKRSGSGCVVGFQIGPQVHRGFDDCFGIGGKRHCLRNVVVEGAAPGFEALFLFAELFQIVHEVAGGYRVRLLIGPEQLFQVAFFPVDFPDALLDGGLALPFFGHQLGAVLVDVLDLPFQNIPGEGALQECAYDDVQERFERLVF